MPVATFYSISSVPTTTNHHNDHPPTVSKSSLVERRISHSNSINIAESQLRTGGLCGLSNLGNTVKLFYILIRLYLINFFFF